jgi:hypothetical protein
MMEIDEFGEIKVTSNRSADLAFMASLSNAAGEDRAAEGYLLELMAWCAFADRETVGAAPQGRG